MAKKTGTPEPVFFRTQQEFHKWLEKNHAKATEKWIGFYKTSASTKGITYKEALDEALCFGWIDAVRKSIDAERWMIRFTPRKKSSIWSQVNIRRYQELKELGKLHETGIRAFDGRDPKKQNLYSFEQEKHELGPDYEKLFKANKTAWENFHGMAPSYRKPAIWWVISAKQEETRRKRLQTLIEDSENGRKIKPLRRPGDK